MKASVFVIVSSLYAATTFAVQHKNCTIHLAAGISLKEWPGLLLQGLTTKNYSYVHTDGDEIGSMPKGSLYGEIAINWRKEGLTKYCKVKVELKEILDSDPFEAKTHYFAQYEKSDPNIFSDLASCIPALRKIVKHMPACEIVE